jgi:FlaA1/EpsC-like NDP-sugar epimerase
VYFLLVIYKMQRIIKFCELSGVKFRTLPGPKEIINGLVRVNQIREVQIEDLLNREVVNFDAESIKEFIKNKVVLVTGAGGSIGSELCRQLVHLSPKKIICLDRSENSLFLLNDELSLTKSKCNYGVFIADILDYDKCTKIFQLERPDFVFHAAAYKHVPLMEDHPEEAIHNNIFGTLNVVKLSEKFAVKKFVLISTDKAVKPSSIMGASKRLAENLLRSYPTDGNLKLIIVRFGNVIGSQGSVVPLFKEQIKRNGPVTVTHEDMSRFFMTISEAVKLILESAKMGEAKEIFILDMGEPLKLKDLARHMITLSGFEPDVDIAIEYTGIRPGEKLFEELWTDNEKPLKTSHQKILKINGSYFKNWDEFHNDIKALRNCCQVMTRKEIYAKFQELIPDYKPFSMS